MSSDWSGTIERLQRNVEELQDALRINDKENGRLRGAIEAYFNFAPGGYAMWEKLTNELADKDTTIARLREALVHAIQRNHAFSDGCDGCKRGEFALGPKGEG